MSTPVRISGGLLACLLFPFSHSAAILFMPAAVAQYAGADAALSILLSGMAGIGVALLACWIANRHREKRFVAMARTVLGKWLGSVVSFLFMAFFVWLFSLVMRDVLDFVAIVLLPETPGRVIAAIFGMVSLYGAWAGLEPIARISFQVMIVILLGLIGIPILVFREFSVLNYSPMLRDGLMPIIQGALPTFSWFAEAWILLALVPHLTRNQRPYRWVLLGMGGGVLALTYLTVICLLVFGTTLTSRFMFPVYSLVQMISLAHFVERIEMVLILIWISGMFAKTTICLYTSAEVARDLFGLKSHRWPALVFAIVGAALTQIWTRTLDLVRWGMSDEHTLIHGGLIVGTLALLLVGSLIHGMIRRKGQGHAQA